MLSWQARRDDRVPVLAHESQQAADVSRNQVDLQRPGGIGVAERESHIRHAVQHHALVGDPAGDNDGLAVHGQIDAAEREQVQARSGDDHIGLKMRARLQPDPACGERVDVIGDDLRLS